MIYGPNLGYTYCGICREAGVDKIERVAPRDHVVLFYENDEELRRSAGAYLSDALLAGSVAVMIASPSHRAILEQELTVTGLDLGELHDSGSWVALDAAGTVSRLLIDGRPDPEAFESIVGEVIVRAAEQGRSVYAYGEMVALLWEARQVNAAIALEGLWNDLGERTPFSLCCSYASASLSDPFLAQMFEIVCSHHSGVVEPYRDRTQGQPSRESAQAFPALPEAVTQARHFVGDTALDGGSPT